MKVAVCISGHLSQKASRAILSEVALSIREFFNLLELSPDYFLNLSFDDSTDPAIIEYYKIDFSSVSSNIFKDYSIDVSSKVVKNVRPETHIERTFKMFQKIYMCNQMKSNHEVQAGFKYDLVFRIRPDMIFFKERTSEIKAIIENGNFDNNVYHPAFPWLISRFTVVDFFAFGSSISMNVYSDVVNHIDSYCSEGLLFHPETLLGYHLRRNGMKSNIIKPVCFFSENAIEMNGFDTIPEKKPILSKIASLRKYLINSYFIR